ncbi:Spc98 family-domain-containing protein [Aspergillus karnatakaensis]|uniref:putative gamma-tubulin complex component GCP5 n=1 Tax=Aspergillus karnatakaensis TaxID=1810916 RepID=UPI003CCDF784
MAVAANLNAVAEELVAAITKTGRETAQFRASKRRVQDFLKTSSHSRTDQFAVANQLEGLLEKFRVLNRDDLADALQPRLAELNEHRGSFFPEILSLLLQLADRPTQLSKVDRIRNQRPEEEEKQLAWADLDASDAAYCDEDIWESVDYGAGSSSEDDVSSVISDTQPSRSFTQPSNLEDDYVIPDDIFLSGDDEGLVASIKSVQFWKEESVPTITKGDKQSTIVLSELQVVREALFMLQGLPSSLFWRLDGSVEVDRRYTLSHLSQGALLSLLRALSSCGAKVDILRLFAQTTQSVGYMQTFHRSVEDSISKFDKFLSDVQGRYISHGSPVPISLLQLSDDVQHESRLLILLADLVSNLDKDATGGIQCLDLLFDLVCLTQASGDDESSATLARIFFSCFETYSRPLHQWIKDGQLDNSGPFFISEDSEKSDLRTLWHDWYRMDTKAELTKIPKFIQPFAYRIFITGKSMIFLKRLNIVDNLEAPRNTSLNFEDVYPLNTPSVCLPFHALLESAFGNLVNKNHAFTASLLRKELDEQCGLWISLQALEHVYLCKDMSVIGPIDSKVFELIDRGKGGWSDRFLLTELAQTSFSSLPFIDSSRLIVRSVRDATNAPNGRSVKILKSLALDYILPWPVANIITKDGIAAYQRISNLLMQIRRAKYTIVKQRLQYSHGPDDQDTKSKGKTLSYALRHNLLWFLNVLYSHLTDFVISSATEQLRKSLSTSSDVDGMISAHRSYMSSLEEQCLLSANLHPLHQATLTILDLCIAFSDLLAARSNHQTSPNLAQTPRKQAPSKPFKTGLTPTTRKTRYEYSYGDEDNSTDEEIASDFDSNELDSDLEEELRPRRPASFHDSQYLQRLKDIHDQFNRLVAFMAAGLKGVGRVDGQISWEMLAEKLEWRKERERGGLV